MTRFDLPQNRKHPNPFAKIVTVTGKVPKATQCAKFGIIPPKGVFGGASPGRKLA